MFTRFPKLWDLDMRTTALEWMFTRVGETPGEYPIRELSHPAHFHRKGESPNESPPPTIKRLLVETPSIVKTSLTMATGITYCKFMLVSVLCCQNYVCGSPIKDGQSTYRCFTCLIDTLINPACVRSFISYQRAGRECESKAAND